MTAPAKDIQPAPVLFVVDQRDEPIRLVRADGAGQQLVHDLTPYQAQCLIEDLVRAVRSRLPGGW